MLGASEHPIIKTLQTRTREAEPKTRRIIGRRAVRLPQLTCPPHGTEHCVGSHACPAALPRPQWRSGKGLPVTATAGQIHGGCCRLGIGALQMAVRCSRGCERPLQVCKVDVHALCVAVPPESGMLVGEGANVCMTSLCVGMLSSCRLARGAAPRDQCRRHHPRQGHR